MKSRYDPRGVTFDATSNTFSKFSWDANMEKVAMLYTKYFSKYNEYSNKKKDPVPTQTDHHTPPAGTAGFIFFKDDYGAFDHVEFYDYTIPVGNKFSRWKTKGIRKVELEQVDALIPLNDWYYVPLDPFLTNI